MLGGREDIPVVVFAGGIVRTLRATLRLRILVEEGVAFNRRHPGFEIGTRLEGVEGLEAALERVLHQILGILRIVRELHRLTVERIDGGHGKLLEARPLLLHRFVFILACFAHALHCTVRGEGNLKASWGRKHRECPSGIRRSRTCTAHGRIQAE